MDLWACVGSSLLSLSLDDGEDCSGLRFFSYMSIIGLVSIKFNHITILLSININRVIFFLKDN